MINEIYQNINEPGILRFITERENLIESILLRIISLRRTEIRPKDMRTIKMILLMRVI